MTRVLVVDDNPNNRSLFEVLFRRHGAEVTSVRDPAGAIASVTRRPPDLVVIDVFLVDFDGPNLAAALRGMPGMAGVPMVAVSAADVTDAQLGSDFSSFHPLPIDPERFVDSVLAHLGAP